MDKKIIAAVGVIVFGCIGMLIWAWRSGDSIFVVTMAIALMLICGVGSFPLLFSRTPRRPADQSDLTITVKEDSKS